MTTSIPPELSARISALESLVFNLYQEMSLPIPSAQQSVADSLPEEVQQLVRAGDREKAIRRTLVLLGVSTHDATLRVDGFLRTLGR